MPLRVHCPVCGYRIKAPEGSYGRRGQCPRCKLMIRLPTAAELEAKEAQKGLEQADEAESALSPGLGDSEGLTLDDDA
jgi:hypothetical protein